MLRVYRSSVKETTHKAPLESPHPHPPYQAQPAAEDATLNAAEEAAHTDTPHHTAADTPRDIEADTPPDIEADTPPPDNADNSDATHADTVSGPPYEIDPSVTMRLPQHLSYQVSCPPLPRPAKGGCTACFSLHALPVEFCCLRNLSLSGLSGI